MSPYVCACVHMSVLYVCGPQWNVDSYSLYDHLYRAFLKEQFPLTALCSGKIYSVNSLSCRSCAEPLMNLVHCSQTRLDIFTGTTWFYEKD